MRAAPRGVLYNLCLMRRRKLLQKLGVVRQAHIDTLLDELQRIGKRHLAMPVMAAVSLAIGGNMHDLRRFIRGETADQPSSKVVAAVQDAFEGDGTRACAVVEKHSDLA